jgi:hypothetical protein
LPSRVTSAKLSSRVVLFLNRTFVDWASLQRVTLTRTSVLRNAPEESGVYGLRTGDEWVYIGHNYSIRKALLAYLSGKMPYVLEWQPKHFVFETLALYKKRIARHQELVAHYQPICNRKTHSAARGS